MSTASERTVQCDGAKDGARRYVFFLLLLLLPPPNVEHYAGTRAHRSRQYQIPWDLLMSHLTDSGRSPNRKPRPPPTTPPPRLRCLYHKP